MLTFFVMMKLVPMARLLLMAKPNPIHLSLVSVEKLPTTSVDGVASRAMRAAVPLCVDHAAVGDALARGALERTVMRARAKRSSAPLLVAVIAHERRR